MNNNTTRGILIRGILIRNILSASPIKNMCFHDEQTENFKSDWDGLSSTTKEHYVRLAELLGQLITSELWKVANNEFHTIKATTTTNEQNSICHCTPDSNPKDCPVCCIHNQLFPGSQKPNE